MKTRFILILFLTLCPACFSEIYKSNVEASYYADKFHGRKTASGEVFNMYSMTCAHKTLPFGTVLRVTNLGNSKTVDVRVNDRGPFVKGREIDLSKAAAQKLDMIKSGTARVKIEIVNQKKETALTTKNNGGNLVKNVQTKKSGEDAEFWDIQVGSFSSHENADKMAQELLRKGFENVYFQKTSSVTRVVLKKVPASRLGSVEARLRQFGYRDLVVRRGG